MQHDNLVRYAENLKMEFLQASSSSSSSTPRRGASWFWGKISFVILCLMLPVASVFHGQPQSEQLLICGCHEQGLDAQAGIWKAF